MIHRVFIEFCGISVYTRRTLDSLAINGCAVKTPSCSTHEVTFTTLQVKMALNSSKGLLYVSRCGRHFLFQFLIARYKAFTGVQSRHS